MVIYSRAADDADNDLTFKLKRSIQLAKENKVAKKNGKKKGERATVSRERRLALALRALLEATDGGVGNDGDEQADAVVDAQSVANTTLNDLGYGSLVGIPKRLKELNEQLKAAVDAGDGKEISRLGLLIDRVKMGKDVEQPKVAERAKSAGES